MTVSSDSIVKNDINKEERINKYLVNMNWKKSIGKKGKRKSTTFANGTIITSQ